MTMTAIKSTCRHCGNHIEHPFEMVGGFTACPHCAKETILAVDVDHSYQDPERVRSACVQCGRNILHPVSKIGASVACPHCDAETRLSMPAINDGTARRWDESTPELRLRRLRSKTCYPALRVIGNLVLGASVLAGGWLVIQGLQDQARGELSGLGYGLLFGALSVLGGLVIREALFVLVDIADTLLERHSREK
jgi:predicted RNA-binding Zn-ribbon protein involved in translation (DUF1610 family)